MDKFAAHFILPLAWRRGWTSVCEIGASTGATTDELLRLPIRSYIIIDPCFDEDLAQKYAGDARVAVQKSNSLDGLPKVAGPCDCILIDGDHNWYTVINELRLIRKRGLLRAGGMIFFHDIEWPYGRRDGYYQPHTIPLEYRQPYECKGVIRGRSQLVDKGGENPGIGKALDEGGPRNGVLTAIEDFCAENRGDYRFCRVRLAAGLGILQYRNPGLSGNLSFLAIQIKALIYSLYGLLSGLNRR